MHQYAQPYVLILSRFCTDLSLWGSNEYGFLDLPDTFASISSAMPHKKNFTILERIRGETAHLATLHLDFLLGQRSTPYCTAQVIVGEFIHGAVANHIPPKRWICA
jgi:argininosuccinate lyase